MRHYASPIHFVLMLAVSGLAYWLRSPHPTELVRDGIRRSHQGDQAGAVALFTQAIEQDPRLPQAWHNRGIIRLSLQDWAAAEADFTKVIAMDSFAEPALAFTSRGAARFHQGDLIGADSDHERALQLDPRCVSAYCNRGQLRDAAGDLKGAVADFTQAIELDPANAEAWGNRGLVRLSQGQAQDGEKDLREAIRLKPSLKEKIERARKTDGPRTDIL